MDTTTAKQASTKFVVLGLLLGILMSAMDNTIVATAMGNIVADLGSFDKFAWVTASYMVAVMAGMPIYGKLSDMYGRKRFFLFGLIFLNRFCFMRDCPDDESADHLPGHSRDRRRRAPADCLYHYL